LAAIIALMIPPEFRRQYPIRTAYAAMIPPDLFRHRFVPRRIIPPEFGGHDSARFRLIDSIAHSILSYSAESFHEIISAANFRPDSKIYPPPIDSIAHSIPSDSGRFRPIDSIAHSIPSYSAIIPLNDIIFSHYNVYTIGGRNDSGG
jgi:hypothetical protein